MLAQLTILRTEAEQLSYELSLALASGALQVKAGTLGTAAMKFGKQEWKRWSLF